MMNSNLCFIFVFVAFVIFAFFCSKFSNNIRTPNQNDFNYEFRNSSKDRAAHYPQLFTPIAFMTLSALSWDSRLKFGNSQEIAVRSANVAAFVVLSRHWPFGSTQRLAEQAVFRFSFVAFVFVFVISHFRLAFLNCSLCFYAVFLFETLL